MSRRKTSTGEDFNQLLAWLNPNGEAAAMMYETIRGNLINIFRWRGCSDPEGMADDTIVRVTRKVGEMAGSYTGSPALYFYGVAKNQLHEYERKRETSLSVEAEQFVVAAPTVEEDDQRERVHDCFDGCLAKLKPHERNLIIKYYDGQGLTKIENRKKLAAELGIDLNALRVRTRRIRAKLRECIEKCVGVGPLAT